MISNNILLVGSKSVARRTLLEEAQIPFTVIEQEADETVCDWGLPLQQLVESIAIHKMNHVMLSQGEDGKRCFVLTADTLSCDSDGNIHGKPKNREDAIAKIKAGSRGSRLGTAFCLDKKIYQSGKWNIEKRIVRFVSTRYHFIVTDEWLETYLEKSFGLTSSGAIAVEQFGAQFLKNVEGSYTTIVGLPMFELRDALEDLNFFR